jgi:transposase, IS30 family
MTHNTEVWGNLKRKYFSFAERQKLEKLLFEGISLRSCADILDRGYSTIQGEAQRKPVYDRYRASYAHRDFLVKQANKGNVRKLDRNERLREEVLIGITTECSPEQIAARITRMGESFGLGSITISHETIYQFLYCDPIAQEQKLYRHLRRSRKHRRKVWSRKKQYRAQIKERVSIHERPAYIEKRAEFWHFETDSVIFSWGRCILSVQYERKTSLVRLTKLRNKTAYSTAGALRSLVHEFDGIYPVRSVTYDNGTENVLHTELIHQYGIATYFADPYSSWQKGWVENANGLIRQYLPRSIDFESMTDDAIYQIQEKLNNRPRKRLNWLTPNEAYAMMSDPDFTITKLF